ncbi:hypothetical protein NXY31_26480 [Bacteroides salyersiae]|nr:hypothetical protein [Bacteroides salyersiae]
MVRYKIIPSYCFIISIGTGCTICLAAGRLSQMLVYLFVSVAGNVMVGIGSGIGASFFLLYFWVSSRKAMYLGVAWLISLIGAS